VSWRERSVGFRVRVCDKDNVRAAKGKPPHGRQAENRATVGLQQAGDDGAASTVGVLRAKGKPKHKRDLVLATLDFLFVRMFVDGGFLLCGLLDVVGRQARA
jgi:hypothetical protein